MKTVADIVADKPTNGCVTSKMNRVKVPRKIHKAEREKIKRDHLNEIFFELGHALNPTRQNNGKASILCDTTRLLRDLIMHVEFLKKEYTTLLNESHYVSVEKNELQEDNAALQGDIVRLQNELQERMQHDPTPLLGSADPVGPSPSPKPSSQVVSRPHPRYPSPDSWPLEFLCRNKGAAGLASDRRQEGLDKA